MLVVDWVLLGWVWLRVGTDLTLTSSILHCGLDMWRREVKLVHKLVALASAVVLSISQALRSVVGMSRMG